MRSQKRRRKGMRRREKTKIFEVDYTEPVNWQKKKRDYSNIRMGNNSLLDSYSILVTNNPYFKQDALFIRKRPEKKLFKTDPNRRESNIQPHQTFF